MAWITILISVISAIITWLYRKTKDGEELTARESKQLSKALTKMEELKKLSATFGCYPE